MGSLSQVAGSPRVGIVVSHLGALLALAGLLAGWASPWWLLVTYVSFVLVGLVGVDGGYHRIVAHKSLEPRSSWALGLLLGLATYAAQGSAMSWATSHRIHHRHADREGDPHSPQDGLWHAYMGWMFGPYVRVMKMGLLRDPVLRLQHRAYPVLLWGGWLAAGLVSPQFLLYGLLLPAALEYVSVGLVNSLGHRGGPRDLPGLAPFFWATAYHRAHHDAPWRGRYAAWDPVYTGMRLLVRDPHG